MWSACGRSAGSNQREDPHESCAGADSSRRVSCQPGYRIRARRPWDERMTPRMLVASKIDAWLRTGAIVAIPFAITLALLGGCATRTTVTQSLGDTKDLVTASDETDASKRARLRMELAAGYFGRGQMTTALDQVKLALQANPTLSEAYNLRGLIYANLGDDAMAEESFRHARVTN